MPVPLNCFTLHFWGVRGSIATPGKSTVRYGGNTPCIEVRCHGRRLIFDAGTGIRVLGQYLLREMPIDADIFFTHSHWDHIQGFPFFVPAFVKGNTFRVHGKNAPGGATIRQRLEAQMLDPNFPVPIEVMSANLSFNSLEVGKTIELGNGISVETGELNHPGEAVGYRVSWDNRAIVYATDTEHFHQGLDVKLLHLARQADILVIDATYTDQEYWSTTSSKVGWGHSTWQEAVKLAIAAQVKRLVIFHHDPLRSDEELDQIGAEVALAFPNSVIAHEGLCLEA